MTKLFSGLSAVLLGLAVAGCQTARDPGLELVWTRVDGRKIDSSAELQSKFEVDKTVCLGETQKSAVGMAPVYYRGIGGAIGAAVIQNQRDNALIDVAKGCMAERGYLRMTRSEALAREAASQPTVKPNRRKMAARPAPEKPVAAAASNGSSQPQPSR